MVLKRPKKPPFVFIDYDGTITRKDTIIAIMEAFAPSEWVSLKEGVLSGEISVRKGVGEMFSLLPSRLKGRIVRFVKKETRIRKGFHEFIQYCRKMKIDYLVISGGLDFYLYPILEEIVPREKIFCNRGDFSGDAIRVDWGFPCDPYCHLDCGFCKASLVRRVDPAEFRRIIIGDSVTDLAAAGIADQVYARDLLLEKCEEANIPALPFDDFIDLRKVISA